MEISGCLEVRSSQLSVGLCGCSNDVWMLQSYVAPNLATYMIGGSVSGLSGTGLVLQDNGGDNMPVNSGATSFTFATAITSGSGYNVSVLSQPAGLLQTCGVASPGGSLQLPMRISQTFRSPAHRRGRLGVLSSVLSMFQGWPREPPLLISMQETTSLEIIRTRPACSTDS